jgi:cell division septal protein FtsQ
MLRPRQYVSKSPQRARKLNRSYGARAISSGASIRKMILAVLLLIFDSVLIGWLSFKLWGFLCTDPEFSVRKIQIRGNKTFSTQEIIKRAGFVYGKNIFKIDIKAARRNLEIEPLFKRVEVWRQLPSEILIKITEREPMAQIVPLE